MTEQKRYKIAERDDKNAVHSIGYHGESGKERAQKRIDSGECIKYWTNKGTNFVVVEE